MDNYREFLKYDIDSAWVSVRRITIKARDFGMRLDTIPSLVSAIDELGVVEAWLYRDDDTGIHPVRARELLKKAQDKLDSANNLVNSRIERASLPNPY